jgi:ribonuclease Z
MHPIPLTRTELHTRVILQSIAHQINESWLGDLSAASQPSIHPAVGSQPGEPSDPVGNLAGAGLARSAITARDFMVLRVPAHELVHSEADGMVKANNESAEVMATWEKYGGVWVPTGDAGRRWVGVDPEPGRVVGEQQQPNHRA